MKFAQQSLALFVLVTTINAFAVEPLKTTELVAQCARHEIDPASLDTARCRSFLQGYMGGAYAMRSVRIGTQEEAKSNFTERAQRTRLGDSRLAFGQNRTAGYCVPTELTISELVANLNRFATAKTDHPATANQFVLNFLKANFACSEPKK